jgi:WASH complex subunit 7
MDEWEGAEEYERRPAEEQMQKMLTFVQEHEVMLKTIEERTRNTIVEAYDSHNRAIKVNINTPERVHAQDLIYTDNEILRKVLSVLVFLCDEVQELVDIAEQKMYRPLEVFGVPLPVNADNNKDGDSGSADGGLSALMKPGTREKMVGKFMPMLQDLSNFIDRCYTVATNFIQQLSSLLRPKEGLYKSTFKNVHLIPCFKALGDLFTVLITLDSVVNSNDVLQDCWGYYKSIIPLIRADPAKFDTTEEDLLRFERLLVSIDQTIMIGEIFKGCIEQNFEHYHDDDGDGDGEGTFIEIRKNDAFLDDLLHCLRAIMDNSLGLVGTGGELFERKDIVGMTALYALYRKLLPANKPPDPKLHKYMWQTQKVCPTVVLSDSVMWGSGQFLQEYAHFDIKKPDPADPDAYLRAYVKSFDEQFNSRSHLLLAQCNAWFVLAESRIQDCVRHESDKKQILEVRASILLKGLSLANRASYLAKSCLVFHSNMQTPLTKAIVLEVGKLVEVLKSIEFTVLRKNQAIQETLTHTQRGSYENILACLLPIIRKLEATSRLDAARADLLSFLRVMENLCKVTDYLSPTRQAVLTLCTHIVTSSANMGEKEATRLKALVRRASVIANFDSELRGVCDTGFLFFHQDILTPLMQSLYNLPVEANRLQYLLTAFSDGIKVCESIAHADVARFFIAYRAFIRDAIQTHIIQPLCADIETNLRLHVHTKTLDHLQTLNPKAENLTPLRPFLDMSPVRVLGLIIDIHHEVKHYLDLNFYNLTTVALHDWRTYAEMRSLAAEKLGLELMNNFLPMGSLDQGLDVLQIMRNIHIFVARFTYNLNTQQFVEFKPDKSSKHLNTIRIQSIAASIKQHGLGVLNTTVNFTYQFLAKKFEIFSQFLFDEYIVAHLGREHRWFRKHKHDPDVQNCYPYERAKRFVQEIKKLGVNKQGKSFLDQFRILITEIGNALGYVRMVRSASMYYCSEAVKFLPEFEDVISFADHAGKGQEAKEDGEPAVEGANLSDETVRSAKNLDDTIETLVKNFGEGSDYFKVLVNVFQSVLLNKEHEHLRTFYAIVPALCISWVEASLQAKDAMFKTTRGVQKEMYFTDDGFAMGVAYCLAILKQTKRWESLHWVDTVRGKLKADGKALAQAQLERQTRQKELAAKRAKAEKKKGGMLGWFKGKKKGDDDDDDGDTMEEDYEEQDAVHTLQVSGKRLEAQRRESEQLFYSLSGAGIFFKRTDVDT